MPVEGEEQTLQAVKFTAKNMPEFQLALDEDFHAAGCFTELKYGYALGLVEPYMTRGLQPVGPNRTTLEVIIPSWTGLTPEKWKETATLCPLDWPSNYSLLRLWHTNGSLHQTEARLRDQLSHSHMFAEWLPKGQVHVQNLQTLLQLSSEERSYQSKADEEAKDGEDESHQHAKESRGVGRSRGGNRHRIHSHRVAQGVDEKHTHQRLWRV